MNKWMATILLIAGAALLQGCVYGPYGGAPVHGDVCPGAWLRLRGYPEYSPYGAPGYGYPDYGGYSGGSVGFGDVWGGGGYRGGEFGTSRGRAPRRRPQTGRAP